MKSKNLVSGALILTFGGFLSKVFSAIYRIAITRILGGEGIGLYQLIFPIYSLAVVLATAGIPLAISKVVSKNKDNLKVILKKSLIFVSVISVVLSIFMIVFGKWISAFQNVSRLSVCYFILSPTILMIGVSSVLRGYFQGINRFEPTAVSNIIEQFVKMVFGLTISLLLVKKSIELAVVGAMVAIAVSELVSLLIMLLYFSKMPKHFETKQENIAYRDLLKDILPIVATNIILPITSFIDSLIVIKILEVNFSHSVSVFLYGLESGAVATLVNLPTLFSFSIASVIMPNLSKEKSHFNNSKRFSFAVKIVLMLSVPFAILFFLIPDRLIELIYGTRLNAYGISGVNITKRLLAVTSICAVLISCNQLFSVALQAINLRSSTIKNLSIGAICKIAFEVAFLPSKLINIYSLAISNLICFGVSFALNYFELTPHLKINISCDFFAKLIISNICMFVSLLAILSVTNSASNTLLGLVVAGIVYFASLIFFKIFTKKDLASLKYKVN